MQLIRTIKARQMTRRQEIITEQAQDLITIDDFADGLYIAYEGVPLIPVEESWTSKDIIQELTKVRQNYINSKIKETC